MFAGIPAEVLSQAGGWGIVGIFVLLIAFGKLIPLSSARREIKLYEERANDFKEAITKVDARNEELARQVAILVPLTEASARLLQEIRDRADRQREAA